MSQHKSLNLTKFVEPLPIPPVLQPLRKDDNFTYYEISMTQFQMSLHQELNPTTVWGYEGSYPGPTIEVESGEQVYIKWLNKLPSTHLLPIDHTVHGAQKELPDVRTVTHVHGAIVKPESDGYPEAWFTKDFAQTGPYFVHEIYHYANPMQACGLWYHDHTMGITRLNVYAGLAGMYIIRDQRERSFHFPAGPYEIPLVIQDKSLNHDGSLYYPRQTDPPVAGLETSIVPEFFGDLNLVNGKVWPYLKVEPRKYRFRLLNAASCRFYQLSLSSGQFFYQIGTDGGLMEHPIGIQQLLLSPAERADVIIDFSNMEGQRIILHNTAPAVFPGGDAPDPRTTGIVMEFRVEQSLTHIDISAIPASMGALPLLDLTQISKYRNLVLDSTMDHFGRHVMLLDSKMWDDPISEKPLLGSTELWAFLNITGQTHPMHVHLGFFQLIDRIPFDAERYQKDGTILLTGPPIPPDPEERGWKDTIRANHGEITRIVKHFTTYTGRYVWHCHMVEHEDYEMMRPFLVVRDSTEQPFE
ncbi:multicopper oxidase domain-containing protein [Lysinibacillus macroides]|uniref:Copper oxidase n=1 Tax=Lysinibacillus macroides TaxID=33935 RepID=A0A0N0UX18_9BACI|nr:multicopper oxidase [Lysinibacillus macroides]KOY82985.1 copper oxidase [Lysinibacillus macroides]QPR70165.1 multicopper oxidase domain-containing protein [Lysinibacillus macroides]